MIHGHWTERIFVDPQSWDPDYLQSDDVVTDCCHTKLWAVWTYASGQVVFFAKRTPVEQADA